MEHFSSALDLPVSEMQMKMVGHVPNHSKSQYLTVSKEQMSMVEPVSSNPEFKHLMIPNNQVGHTESSGGSVGSNPMWMSNQLGQEDANMVNRGNTSLPVKRKAEVGPLSNNSVSQPWLLPSKRPTHMGAESSFPQPSVLERKSAPAHSKLGSQGLQAQSLLNKKVTRNESMTGKSGLQRGQSAKKQVTQIGSASKAQLESSGAVRSKMRESLAAALALASPCTDNASNTEKDQIIATSTDLVPADSQASGPNSTASGLVPGSDEMFHSKESSLIGKPNDFQVSAELPPNGSSGNGERIFQEFPYSSILPDEDTSFSNHFFDKDDLLQGNGLSWAFDFDVQMMEGKEAQDAEKLPSVKQEDQGHRDRKVDANLTPENLALEIEIELFKLHGGVNKKYKEKGRSLLFNLKDRNNPELRERVMSGEISPERLCSMSAEELASKELSQWRMAKAEEFAQMVVLPDTEVDIRRLVRKTHKGEFQVEVEHDDGIIAEVSGGASMLTRPLPKKEKPEPHSPPKASSKDKEYVAGQENSSENQDFSGSLIIPTDGADLMQGMIVDELKDPDFLPPIVSLDEFMESLNTEPPFENLSADSEVQTPLSNDKSPKAVNNSLASDRASDSPRDAPSKKVDVVKKSEVGMPMKLSGSPAKQKVLPSTSSKVEYIWEGNLELTISSSITVGGLFQSGEKTSTKEWPKSLEIKGRVRLDAFEKFLQELPKSRTRAVMVLQFVLKDKSSETERSNFAEAVESFAEDERLGYAEPVSAVELYLCPPTQRMTDILNKLMPKERPEANNSIENGLIGVVVWRRAHISNTISPNSSSHHKHSMKKQSFAPPKRVQDSSNFNANTPTRTTPPRVPAQPQPQPEEDDDVPPGFGPTAPSAKDDDDLPEFNFSGDINPSASKIHVARTPQRPVDKVRELIQKYGQSGTSTTPSLVDNRSLVGIEPWNDDEDDDIPEWRPQAPPQLHHQSYPVVHGLALPVHLLPTNPHMAPPMVAQPPIRGVAQPPQGGRWAPPPGPLHGTRWRHH